MRIVANVLIGLVALSHLGFLVLEMFLRIFSLGCVIVAGVFGALTAKTSILFVQALPAAIALAVSLLVAGACPSTRPRFTSRLCT